MLSKSTLIKIVVGLLVVAVIWFVMKLRKSKKPSVIVTSVPVFDAATVGGYEEDSDFQGVTQGPKKEGFVDFGDWQDDANADDSSDDSSDDESGDDTNDDAGEEGFAEYSDVNFKSDLLA